jgi:hypothetical protein
MLKSPANPARNEDPRSLARASWNEGGAQAESPSGPEKPAFNGFQGPAYPPCLPPDLFD